jgi:hypothetical protein
MKKVGQGGGFVQPRGDVATKDVGQNKPTEVTKEAGATTTSPLQQADGGSTGAKQALR